VIKRCVCTLTCGTLIAGSAMAAPTGNLLVTLENPYSAPGKINSEFGAAVSATPSRTYVGAPKYDRVGATDSGTVAVFRTLTGQPISDLPTAFHTQAGANAGASLASSLKFLLIGNAGFTADGHGDAGAVTLWNVSSGRRAKPRLTIPNWQSEPDAQFGAAVAMNKTRMVIGAPGANSNSGAANVLGVRGQSAIWGVDLTIPAVASDQRAGSSVAISAGVIAVGLPGATVDGKTSAGKVALFNPNTLAHIKTIENPKPVEGDQFGYSVAATGSTVLVGTPYADRKQGQNSILNTGLVYQFTGTDFATQSDYKPQNQNSENGNFGSSVATNGSLLVVGAPNDSEDAAGDGTVYLFDFKTTSLLRRHGSHNPVSGGRFGASVAVASNLAYVVGAPGEKAGADITGRAYVYGK